MPGQHVVSLSRVGLAQARLWLKDTTKDETRYKLTRAQLPPTDHKTCIARQICAMYVCCVHPPIRSNCRDHMTQTNNQKAV